MRKAEIARKTTETQISVALDLDGSGRYDIKTGIGFLDHMLEQLSRHSLIDLTIRAEGDTHIDLHHTTEDVGIALGAAIGKALGERKGITRYASIDLPMDEVCTRAAVDVSGRPYPGVAGQIRAAEGRRVRHRALPRVLSGAGAACRDHAAHREPLRREQPPYRRNLLQGGGAGVSRRLRHRPAEMPRRCLRPRERSPARMFRTMRLYSVHAPPEEPLAPERFVFIKEGFSWPALFLPVIWMLWHRMWLTLVYYIVYLLVIAWIGRLAGQDMATLAFAPRQHPLRARGEQSPAAFARKARLARSRRSLGRNTARRRRASSPAGRRNQPAPRSETPPRAAFSAGGARPRDRASRSSGSSPSRRVPLGERRHHRLRLGEPALRGKGVRARGARDRRHDRRHFRRRDGRQRRSASCCRASAPSPIAAAGSTRCRAWWRRCSEAVIERGKPFLGICVGCQLMAERGLEKETTGGSRLDRRRRGGDHARRPGTQDPAHGLEHARRRRTSIRSLPASRPARRGSTPISCTPSTSCRATRAISSPSPTMAGR